MDVQCVAGGSSDEGAHSHEEVLQGGMNAAGSGERQSLVASTADKISRRARPLTPSKAPAAGHVQDCFLCESELLGTDKQVTWRDFNLHDHCRNAVRCAIRQVTTKPEKDELIKMAAIDPAAFRDHVEPLIVRPGQPKRGAGQRLQFIKKTKQQVHGKFSQRATMLLTKKRFKGWKRMWENMEADDASFEFESLLDQASSDNADSDAEPRVRVRDNEREVETRGTKETYEKHRTRDANSDDESSMSTKGRRARRARDHKKPRRVASTGDGMDEDDDEDEAPLTGRKLQQSHRRPCSPASVSTLQSPKGISPVGSVTGSESAARSSRKRGALAATADSKIVQFLHRKAEVKTTLQAFIAEISMPKTCVLNRIAEAIRRVEEHSLTLTDAPITLHDVQKKMKDIITALRAKLNELSDVAMADLDTTINAIDEKKQHFGKYENIGREQIDAVNFMYSEVKKEGRKDRFKKRYETQTVSKLLHANGFSKNLAHDVAKCLSGAADMNDPHAVCTGP